MVSTLQNKIKDPKVYSDYKQKKAFLDNAIWELGVCKEELSIYSNENEYKKFMNICEELSKDLGKVIDGYNDPLCKKMEKYLKSNFSSFDISVHPSGISDSIRVEILMNKEKKKMSYKKRIDYFYDILEKEFSYDEIKRISFLSAYYESDFE